MKRYSVNGVLVPLNVSVDTDSYTGHFLKVNYIHQIKKHSVYSSDRVDVNGNGSFRFFIPKEDLITDEMVNIEVYAPDGEMLGKQVYSYGSLKASLISESAEDDSEAIEIKIDPKNIQLEQTASVSKPYTKIKGKVIDISGERKASSLQVIIMVSDDPNAVFSSDSYIALFSTVTDKEGYFFGQVDNNKTYQKAYGLIAGLESQPVLIHLDEGKLPQDILLVTDLSDLPEDSVANENVPSLPDSDDLVNSSSFSQDIGGKCVDFTIPNRTLEEFSFYHVVRTTEPEIKGLTITSSESKKLKTELYTISDNLFNLFKRLNSSFTSISVIPYNIAKEVKTEVNDGASKIKSAPHSSKVNKDSETVSNYIQPIYHLEIASGINNFTLSTQDLLVANKGFYFTDLIKAFSEQEKRRRKLIELHHRLSAAYCGKHGAEEAQSYCETLKIEDHLNRRTLESLLGHITEYIGFIQEFGNKLEQQFSKYLSDIKDIAEQPFVSSEILDLMRKKSEALIKAIDKETTESQDQEELLGYLRRIVGELVEAKEEMSTDFELCPPTTKSQTIGVLCLIQEFDSIRETIRNKAILSLDHILDIRAQYDTFLSSISAFLNLLEEFHTFYTSSTTYLISLEDDYFVEHYTQTKSTLLSLKKQIYRAIYTIDQMEMAYISNHPGRKELSVENSVDWDETPTIYENTTIAHGHILHFKQKWKADGYSLGDLLYSLPLAPCQEKQIAIIDWDRQEQGTRTEAQNAFEELHAGISRDRDIAEIAHSSFNENINANSTNKTSSTSGGIGGGVGGFLSGITFGLFGGVSSSGASSRSTSHQDASRNLSASALNRLRDNVTQSASSLRGQRSTVIQTVGQREDVNVQTEVVKNNNHCHAMTVEYFEVLKHYALEQELVDVQECLFVPLPMSHFDHQKVLRWSNTLKRAIYGSKLRRGFDAIERIESNYVNSDLPVGTYSNETIEEFTGNFTISFELTRPYIEKIEDATKTVKEYFPWCFGLWGIIGAGLYFKKERELTENEKNAIFERDYAPDIVRSFIDTLEIDAITDDGTEVKLDLDLTLLSNYRKGYPLQVSIASKNKQNITRKQIKYIRFRANTDVKASSKIILRSAYLHYKTKHLSEYIVRNSHVNNDIINSSKVTINLFEDPWIKIETKTDAALLYTPLSDKELRNPRKEDQEAASALISFLNEHMEMSHKIIWSSMDSSRLFGLLDGYIAPNAGGKSVASVAENKIMGIVGNNLILKVVPGERLDPFFKYETEEKNNDLFEYYKTTTKPDPFRISIPTKGVYAESVMGKCISCEEIDDTRHWRFEDVPCGTKPTAINPISTESRRSNVGDLQVKDLPTNLINMQTAPAAPDPTGLTAAYNLLGKSGIFSDITGLSGTQANALNALKTTSQSVTDLAAMSKDIVGSAVDFQKQKSMKKDIGKTLKTIDKAKVNKQITEDQAKELSYSALSSVAGKPTMHKKLTEEKEVKDAIKKASDDKKGIEIKRGAEEVKINEDKKEDGSNT